MISQPCFFHPSIEAVDKCERCNKLICLQDKRTFTSSVGSDSFGSSNLSSFDAPIKYTFCPPCFYQVTESQYTNFRKISSVQKPFLLIFLIPFIIIPLFLFSMFSNSSMNLGLFILFPIFFIIIALGMFVFIFRLITTSKTMAQSEMQRIESDKAQFYNSNNSTNKNFNTQIFCHNCGSKIQTTDLFCPSCGSSTKN